MCDTSMTLSRSVTTWYSDEGRSSLQYSYAIVILPDIRQLCPTNPPEANRPEQQPCHSGSVS